MNMIFDSHAHYDDDRFSEDRDQLLHRLFSEDHICGIVNAACDTGSIRTSMALAERFPALYFAAGLHPEAADEWNTQAEALLAQALTHPKCVAVGEIGLDYHYEDNPSKAQQKMVFEQQLILAVRYDLPVIVHSREACEDTLSLLRQYRPKGVLHCFSYAPEIAKEVCSLGLYLGFNGVVTFKNAKKPKAAAQVVPSDRLLLETDCPYMAPEPYRGKRCDSSLLPETIAVLAALRGTTPEAIAQTTTENACRLFGIQQEK